ncbi:S8 family serine peptidase [Clostridium algidicarnis]|uniref:S8 family serine peptidase n=1 Tax=Clostridium algidicarnis TaxID=37659 RepID=UPI001C0E36B4|nr:S8 family serine peptidase [Clostridium algidicarnis]MBU3206684.1 S8 family serine peptidase [Clostridium algidicarnis]
MRGKNKFKKIKVFFPILLSFTLILGCLPTVGQARTMSELEPLDNLNEYLNKIDSKVKKQLENDDDLVEVLIYLKDRVSINEIEEISKSQGDYNTSYENEVSKRKTVINTLKEKAETSQNSVVSYLSSEKLSGKVEKIQSFYIANIVYVKANKEVIEEIAKRDDVEKIYFNDIIKLEEPIKGVDLDTVTNMAEDEIEWNIKKVEAPKVWENFKIDGTGVVVGILDSGVDWTNPALKDKWRGYDKETGTVVNPKESWYDPMTNSELPWDNLGVPHGSHCTGTILGQESNGDNTIGVAPGAKWIAAKAFTDKGGQQVHLLAGAQWFLAPGGKAEKAPNIINNSWGGSAGVDPWFKDVIAAWRSAGILPVFAAGNQKSGEPKPWPGSIQNPSNLPGSFAVAAVDINNKRGDFSKLGPSPWDPKMIKPEISAPGVNIRSSVVGGYEGGWNGTSMAAPHVSGIAALMKSANFSLTVDEIETIIKETATKLTDNEYTESPNMGYGFGLINAYDTVSKVLGVGTGTIEGQVLISGEDKVAPTVIHEKLPEVFAGLDATVIAEIKDNVSVTDAKLLVKNDDMGDWKEIDMKLKDGDSVIGTYEAIIPGDLVIKTGVDYKIVATDYGNNIFTTDEYKLSVMFGIKPDKYSNDFETDIKGFKLSGDFQWGAPTSFVGPKALSGTKVIGTKLDTYGVTEDIVSEVVLPSLDLRDEDLKSASLRISEWSDISSVHSAKMLISTDEGTTWEELRKVSGGDREWHEVYVDLKSYIGSENPVQIKFEFSTMSENNGYSIGWYFDNLRLVGEDKTAPSIPTNVKLQRNKSGISLSWDKVNEADLKQYDVYRSETAGGHYTKVTTTTNTFYTDTDVKTGKYYYVITSSDFVGNESDYSKEAEIDYKEIEKVFYENFEKDNGGFTTGILSESGKKNDWEWGVPTSGPKTALTGTKVWATNLKGNYSYEHSGYLDTPSISLPDDEESVLSVDQWMSIYSYVYEGTDDFANIQISEDDGETWKVLKDTMRGSKSWETVTLDLSEYKGKTVKIRFYLYTNDLMGGPGWYIDSVTVLSKKDNVNNKLSLDFLEKFNLNFLDSDSVDKDNGNHKFVEGFLPADAVVTILETGRSVKTDLTTGGFTITHAGNKEGENYTLRAVSYGYYPKEVKVSLKPGETVTEVIKLDPIKQGNITGKVVDKATNTAIANATVKVLEDSNIKSVITDEEGNFTINEVFAGDYTLRVMSRDFYTENINVTVEGEKDNLVNVAMRKFVGVEDEIAYDDGTSEDARVFVNAGVGFGVRFTPKSYGRVKEANIFFVDNHKKALGNKIGISIVYIDKKGKISEVGDLKEVTIERGKWNKIDLLDYDFATDKDFYIVTKQLYPAAQSPAIGIDKDSLENERSYVYTGGLTPIADYEIDGAMMIRAIMDYEVESPKEEVTTPNITNLKELNYTNKDNIILEGNMNIEGKVNVFVNDEKVTTVDTENKLFSANIQVKEGENNITISGEADGKTSKMSSIIKVIGDTTSPEVTIEVPVDSDLINKATIEITGNAKDDNLKNVTVNEKEVIVDEKGNFNISIPAVSGENIITAIATDLAENQTTVTKKVNVVNAKVTTPEITNLKEINYINTDTVTLEGKMNVEGNVSVFVNDEKVATVETKDKLFTVNLDLKEEINIITISGEENGVTTKMSEKVKVIVDKTSPEVTVEVPKDMDVVNKDSIEITGNAKDNNLKNVTVNEEEVYLDEDGNFKIILPVVGGENTITVVATDLAGNETVVTKKVTITKETKIPETEDPVIKEPKDDTPKVDVPKTGTPKAETPKTGTPKASGPKTTTTKTKLVKTGSLVNTSSMMLLGISLIIGGYIFIRKQKK